MERCILYFLAGTNYAARFLVSLTSLRKHHPDVPVVVLSNDRLPWLMRFDGKFGVQVLPCPLAKVGRNASYCTKSWLHRFCPAEQAIFLDADTLTVGDIGELWPQNKDEFVITQFSNWVTTGKIVSGRVKRLEKVAPELVRKTIAQPLKSINTGIFSFQCGCPFLEPWHELVMKMPAFMIDELAAEVLHREYPHRLLDDRWNCSPKFGVNKDKAIVWHAHGESHARVGVSFPQWWKQLQECWAENMLDCRSWLGPLFIKQEKEAMARMGISLV